MLQKIKCYFDFHVKQKADKAIRIHALADRGVLNQIFMEDSDMTWVDATFKCPACGKEHEDSWHFATYKGDERGFSWDKK